MNSNSRAISEARSSNGGTGHWQIPVSAESTLRTQFSKMDRLTTEGAVLGACFCLAFLLRFGGRIPAEYAHQMWLVLFPFVAARILINVLFGVQKTPWRYFSMADTFRLTLAHSAFSGPMILLSLIFPGLWSLRLPASVLLIEWFLSIQAAIALRTLRRYFYERRERNSRASANQKSRRLLLIGAGTLGSTVAKEMSSTAGITIVGFLDDDRTKVGSIIARTPVIGTTAILPDLVQRGLIDDVLVCIRPTARNSFNRIWALLEHLPVRKRIVPTVQEILDAPDTAPRAITADTAPNSAKAITPAGSSLTVGPSRIQGKTVLITGGAGFIGSSLAGRLADDNQLILLDRLVSQQPISFTSLLRHPNVRVVQADIMDGAVLDEIAKQADIVVHAAAIVGVGRVCNYPRETLETNFVGTSRLLHALERSPRLQRVLYFSTSEVFGVNSFRVHEDAPTAVGPAAEARWSYAIAKLAGEHLAKSYHRQNGMPVVTVRPFNVFGPRRVGAHAIRSFVLSALLGQSLEIHGDGSQIRSWCYIEDFVDALIEMMARPAAAGEDFNIGNPQNTLTVQQLAEKIIEFTGSKSSIVFRESHIPDIDVRVPSLQKARRLLGYRCKYDMDRALALTIDWYRSHLAELCNSAMPNPWSINPPRPERTLDTLDPESGIPAHQLPAHA